MEKKRHLFLTGVPGVGKTTLIKALLTPHLANPDTQCAGFYTDEVREAGRGRVGFEVVSVVDGGKAMLSGVGLLPHVKVPMVGKFRVDVAGFERLALAAMSADRSALRTLVVIDEIGKMELFSAKFKVRVRELLETEGVMLLCTVPVRSIQFVEGLKERGDVELIEITKENRDGVKVVLAARLEMMLNL